MTRIFALLLGVLVLIAPFGSAAPVPKPETAEQIPLKDHINVKMTENLHSERFPDNNLKSLKAGQQKLGDVTYTIGDGVLQLGSSEVKEKPEKIEGIKVGRMAAKLHFLQGAGYDAPDATVVGRYIIRYADKSKVDVDIVYGKDVVDWWAYPEKDAPTKSKIAWEGENEASKSFKAKIRLYHMVWTNPNPEKPIASIDFVATDVDQMCAPFCAAITAEAVQAKPEVKNEK